jgi:hypothetical protein
MTAKHHRIQPNFCFIGPDKAGSSWLFEILRQHPECYVPPCKDIYFFDRYYSRGIAWYLSFFSDVQPNALAIGEISHDYLFSRLAAERIKIHLPHVRLLTCLRNPVDRTFSHYLYLVRSGLTCEPFESALKNIPRLLENSRYDQYLPDYFQRFSSQQVKILFFDDLQSNPEAFAETVFRFLGVSVLKSIDCLGLVRPASRPQSVLLARLAKRGSNFFRDRGFPNLVGKVKHSRLTRFLYRPYEGNERPVMNDATRRELEEFFRPSVLHLQEMLQVNLSHWLSQETTEL